MYTEKCHHPWSQVDCVCEQITESFPSQIASFEKFLAA